MNGDDKAATLWNNGRDKYVERWGHDGSASDTENTQGRALQGYLDTEANEPPPEANPKNAFGLAKPPIHLIPGAALVQVAMVMKLGAEKYGAANWRDTKVTASTYVGAAQRHLLSWYDGEGIDPESGASHIAHMVACGLILLDALACGKFIDDRPTPAPTGDLIAAYTREVAK